MSVIRVGNRIVNYGGFILDDRTTIPDYGEIYWDYGIEFINEIDHSPTRYKGSLTSLYSGTKPAPNVYTHPNRQVTTIRIVGGNLNSLENTFHSNTNLKNIDLKEMNCSNVSSLHNAFNRCVSLKTLDLSMMNYDGIREFMYAFYGCENLETLDLSNLSLDAQFIISSGNHRYAFDGCNNLKAVYVDNCNDDTINVLLISLNANDPIQNWYGPGGFSLGVYEGRKALVKQ